MKTKILTAVFACFWVLCSYAGTNLLSGWDGNGDNNQQTSFPDQYGWNVNPGTFNYANSAAGLRWMDVTSGHSLNGSNYAGRLMMLRWDGAGDTSLNSEYSFPLQLEAGKRYKFSWIYEWWNNASAPQLTAGISTSRAAADNIQESRFQCSSTRNLLLDGEFTFSIQESGIYYLTITGNSIAALCGIGNLYMEEMPPALEANIDAVLLNFWGAEVTFNVFPNGSSDAITLSAPENITLSPQTLPSIGGEIRVSSKDSTSVVSNIVIRQGNDEIQIPLTADFPAGFVPPIISTITEKGAWCWFADSRAVHFENESGTIKNTYIGYIDVHGAIKATQINHLNNTKNEVLIRSYFQPDDHNNPTFLVLPDERIMIFYSRHTDEACFYYRISQKPGDITTLGKEVRLATANNTTYPSPFILSDDPNHIYLCWRGINWHPTIGRLPIPRAENNDVVDFNWGPKQIVQSTGSRPYAKYASNGKDKIYLTYTTGHPDNESPNWIYFNHININTDPAAITLTDVKGKVLSTINNEVHNVNKTNYNTANPDAVVDNSSYRNWVWEVSMDSENNPVIAMVRISGDKTSHDYYYAKWTGSEWRKTFLENGDGHFHQTPGLELCYSGGMAIDDADANIVYCSVPIEGKNGKVYELKKYTIGASGTIENTEQLTFHSQKNNIRPYMITNSGEEKMLVWMNGDYYDWIVSSSRPLGYPTGIQCNFKLPEAHVDINNGLLKHEEFDNIDGITGNATINDGMLAVSQNKKATIATTQSNSFTVTLSPYINHNAYSGEILKIGNLVYGLSSENNAKPYLQQGNDIYSSSNVLGNSDVWKTANRGTGGEWPTASKFKFFSLAITYENGVLKTYINGLLDQYLEIQGLTLSDVTIGGFNGYVDDCRIYNRVLNQDELKLISDGLKGITDKKEAELEFGSINIPADVYTDVVLKTKLSTGNTVIWGSSNTEVIANDGVVTLPEQIVNMTLTATSNIEDVEPKVFNVRVHPRNIGNNKKILYQFRADDVYRQDGLTFVSDKSGNGNDAIIYGSAQVNGALDLTSNTLTGFSENGYAMAPFGMLDNLRSYSFVVKVKPTHLDKLPRIYDFGSASSNSVFGRLNGFCAGLKYNGGTTVMINSPQSPLSLGIENTLAFTFDAKTKTTKIFVNSEESANGVTIINEPYQIAEVGSNNRNYIGRTQWWDTSLANDNADYCGTIDDFYLFDIALTKEELLSLDNPSSDIQNRLAPSLSIYPNPVSKNGSFFIDHQFKEGISTSMLDILNMQGQLIQRLYPKDFPASVKAVFPQGIYIVKMTNGKSEKIQGKLLVQ